MTASVYVGLGSNQDRENKIRGAVKNMQKQFGDLQLSPVYDSVAVGFNGDNFLNMVVGFETDNSVQDIVKQLRAIEDLMGRDRSQPKFSARGIDLDILSFDELIMERDGIQVPRHEILKNAFVLKPLQDIAGDRLHPELKQSYASLWQQMKAQESNIELFKLPI